MAQATPAAGATAGTPPGADTRNLHWKQSNVGKSLLEKLGWQQGQALGSKHRKTSVEGGGGSIHSGDNNAKNNNNNTGVVEHSGEGLKIVKRPMGLGLGATLHQHNPESTSHDSFTQLLHALNKEHTALSQEEDGDKDRKERKRRRKDKKQPKTSLDKDGDDNNNNNNNNNAEEEAKSKSSKSSRKDKKKNKVKETIFATNKITHARVRQSKFATKSASDMACIFGKEYTTHQIAEQTWSMVQTERQLRKENKRKQREADKNNATSTNLEEGEGGIVENGSAAGPSAGKDSGSDQEQKKKRREERKRKRKEKEKKESKEKDEK